VSIQPPIIEGQDPAIIAGWYALFLSYFPEFGNTTLYPVNSVETWIVPAAEQINQARFGTQYNLAVCLYIAHNVVLSAREAQAAISGKSIVGDTRGPVASKSIDKVSVSYNNAAASVEGAGAFNATSYGQRLYKLIQAFASGPYYAAGPRYRGRW